jgi:hypothetical protein
MGIKAISGCVLWTTQSDGFPVEPATLSRKRYDEHATYTFSLCLPFDSNIVDCRLYASYPMIKPDKPNYLACFCLGHK